GPARGHAGDLRPPRAAHAAEGRRDARQRARPRGRGGHDREQLPRADHQSVRAGAPLPRDGRRDRVGLRRRRVRVRGRPGRGSDGAGIAAGQARPRGARQQQGIVPRRGGRRRVGRRRGTLDLLRSALIDMNTTAMSATTPWYRHRWPWLLAIAPTAALVGGIVTFWLAATTTDSMVDDYYREGRAINQQLARDRQASALGLQAELSTSTGTTGATITLALTAARGADWPARLGLRVVHATRAELDVAYMLTHDGGGVY